MEAKSEGEEERERRRKKKLASRSLALFSLHNFSFSLSPSLWLSLQRALLLASDRSCRESQSFEEEKLFSFFAFLISQKSSIELSPISPPRRVLPPAS
jgi:hypothetical protein